MIWLIIRSAGDNFSLESSPKLDFLKAASVTTIGNSENENIPSHFGFPHRFSKKFFLLLNALETLSFPLKMSGRE